MTLEVLRRLAKAVPMNSVGWFDVLRETGAFNRWLVSENDSEFNYATWLLDQREVIIHRGDTIATMIRGALKGIAENQGESERRTRLLSLFGFNQFHANVSMFDLF